MVSLHRKLLLWLLLPQLVLWVAGGFLTYRLAATYANRAIDAGLAQASRALLRQVKPIEQGLLIDFPRAAQDVLEADPNDPLMYTVSTPPGHFILGNENLPAPPARIERKLDTPYFYDGEVVPQPDPSGTPKQMRIAALYVAFGDISAPQQTMLVQVARSSANREELARAILADTLLPLSGLVLLMSVIVWAGIRAGLAPLARLRREVESRAPGDLTPLKLDLAPSELRSLAGALNDLLASVRHHVGAQQRFIADAAHQLRTPLAGLKSQTKLALEAASDEAQRTRLDMVHQSATRSAHLVAQLLTLARAEPGAAAALERSRFDLHRFVREVAAHLVPRALRSGVDLGVDAPAGEIPILANAALLREALSNLVDNAIRYAGRGAEVTLRVKEDGAGAVIVVDDNGPGIPAADRERVFERFVRATEGGDGCGLGLAIVREIIERHQGSVTLGDAEPHGLRVTIRLPREPQP
ncbi:sensor histidine kinase [Pseudoduganella albidiflava]|uniref:histidine kinase n=1 Tax=Pseudoduganella albidiflava TaxID=321983 RepID=A0A411WZI2_9BURK|nr:sensor histidine kinase [Pseudoduganella albidiflava]QBI02015.1 sensor histidine kinase [Pseudoduganella albidiflava]GGY37716.1 sensor histidine kinase [Pseudoduganella albidiflava]